MSDYGRSSECCPKCGGETYQDSVDVGVGIIHGPLGCTECGWSEDADYDMSDPANRQPDERGGYKDQYGGYHPPGSSMALAFRLAASPPSQPDPAGSSEGGGSDERDLD